MSVFVRERENDCVRVCVCVREREREKDKNGFELDHPDWFTKISKVKVAVFSGRHDIQPSDTQTTDTQQNGLNRNKQRSVLLYSSVKFYELDTIILCHYV